MTRVDTMPFIRCPTPADTAAAMAALQASRGDALILCFGSEDPATGASWCPDCVVADPVLRAACVRLRGDLTVYECPVGQRSDWKQRSDHPYRNDPLLRLQRIPTLILVEQGLELRRLVEGDCARAELVAAFLTGATPGAPAPVSRL